jgi:hypothetical protein
MSQLWSTLLVLGLTGFSGALDARGFVYASRAWPGGALDLRWGISAVVAFIGGMSCYVLAVRFMHGLGVQGAVLQSALWFVVTAIGVALMDGSILNWSRTQQVVAMLVAVGLGWLMATTAAGRV